MTTTGKINCFESWNLFCMWHLPKHYGIMRATLLSISRKQKRPTRNMPSWWLHQMETFSALLDFMQGIHRPPLTSPHKGQWRGALIFSLICTWTNNWANNGDTRDLRRHRAHHDVTIMDTSSCCRWNSIISHCTQGNVVANIRCTFSHITSNDNEIASLTKISWAFGCQLDEPYGCSGDR